MVNNNTGRYWPLVQSRRRSEVVRVRSLALSFGLDRGIGYENRRRNEEVVE